MDGFDLHSLLFQGMGLPKELSKSFKDDLIPPDLFQDSNNNCEVSQLSGKEQFKDNDTKDEIYKFTEIYNIPNEEIISFIKDFFKFNYINDEDEEKNKNELIEKRLNDYYKYNKPIIKNELNSWLSNKIQRKKH